MSAEVIANVPMPDAIIAGDAARHHRQFDVMTEHIGSIEELTDYDISDVRESNVVVMWGGHEVTLQQRLLESARIDIVGKTSYSQQPLLGIIPFAPVAYERLIDTLDVHEQFCGNDDFVAIAENTNQGIQGTEYNFGLETKRDTARLFFAAGAITGNVKFTRLGIQALDQTIAALESGGLQATDPTITPLIIFERTRAARKIGEATLEEQHQYYRDAYAAASHREEKGHNDESNIEEVSNEMRNKERAATLAAWETIDAHREGNELFEAEAQANFDAVPHGYEHIMKDQKKKARFEGVNQITWQRTRFLVPHKTVNDVNERLSNMREKYAA